jgi:hypothetical protein
MCVKIPWLLAGRIELPAPSLTDYGLSLGWLNLAFDMAERRAATEELGDCVGVE